MVPPGWKEMPGETEDGQKEVPHGWKDIKSSLGDKGTETPEGDFGNVPEGWNKVGLNEHEEGGSREGGRREGREGWPPDKQRGLSRLREKGYNLEEGKLKCTCLRRKWKFCPLVKEIAGGKVTSNLVRTKYLREVEDEEGRACQVGRGEEENLENRKDQFQETTPHNEFQNELVNLLARQGQTMREEGGLERAEEGQDVGGEGETDPEEGARGEAQEREGRPHSLLRMGFRREGPSLGQQFFGRKQRKRKAKDVKNYKQTGLKASMTTSERTERKLLKARRKICANVRLSIHHFYFP